MIQFQCVPALNLNIYVLNQENSSKKFKPQGCGTPTSSWSYNQTVLYWNFALIKSRSTLYFTICRACRRLPYLLYVFLFLTVLPFFWFYSTKKERSKQLFKLIFYLKWKWLTVVKKCFTKTYQFTTDMFGFVQQLIIAFFAIFWHSLEDCKRKILTKTHKTLL